MPQRGFKEALVSDNEESDDELRITGLVLRSCSLITLLSSAFFAPIIFLLLTADTSRDEAQAASLSESWLDHETLSLSVRILLSISRKFNDVLLVWSWLCFAFYRRTFLRSGAFHDNEMNWFRKRVHSYSSKKCYRVEIGSSRRKVARESITYEDYVILAVY